MQRHDTQLTSLRTTCDELSVKVTALATSQPVTATGSISSPAQKVNSQSFNHDVNDILNELKDRDNRRCNVEITCLNSSRYSDDELVETILNELHVTATISSLR